MLSLTSYYVTLRIFFKLYLTLHFLLHHHMVEDKHSLTFILEKKHNYLLILKSVSEIVEHI